MTGSPETLRRQLMALLSPDAVLLTNEPLAGRTTLRVGGRADCYVEPSGEADLARVVEFCSREAVPLFVLGRGSNLLVRDGGLRGVVVCLAAPAFTSVEAEGARLRCGAGARLKAVALEARRSGLGGLEFFEGIPGSLGGALRMNAGAMGASTFDVVESLRAMGPDGRVVELARAEIEVGYRHCPLLEGHLALGAVVRGEPCAQPEIESRRESFNRRRWATQPAAASAGCVFRNPEGIAAGRLIDELGLKGMRVGGAVVSEVHGNFIVNDGRATARDVMELIAMIRDRARTQRGVDLATEVRIVGEPEPADSAR